MSNPERPVQINVKVSQDQKKSLQRMANINTDGDVTALIKMFIDNEKEIHREFN